MNKKAVMSNYFNSKKGASEPSKSEKIGNTRKYKIDFESLNEAAMEHIELVLERWLPEGEVRGREYVALNPRRNDNRLGSFSINMETGVWKEFASDEEGKQPGGAGLLSLIAYLGNCSFPSAARSLQVFLGAIAVSTPPVKTKAEFQKKAVPDINEWTRMIPAPADAPAPPLEIHGLGVPISKWPYRDANGDVICWMYRFEPKDFRPVTYCQHSSGKRAWRVKGCPEPRPLYRLDQIAANLEAPVLICEGEKTADAAQKLFPAWVATTSMHGSESPAKSDWSVLKGRQVYIWPDSDDAGTAYATKVVDLVRTIDPDCQISIMKPLECLPGYTLDKTPVLGDKVDLDKGWDAADAVEAGWTPRHLQLVPDGLWVPVLSEPASLRKGITTISKPSRHSSDEKPKLLEVVNQVVEHCFGGHVLYLNGEFRMYREGCWPRLHRDAEVRRPIAEFLGMAVTPKFIQSITGVMEALYAEKDQSEHRSNLICLNNGTLDPLTGQLLPHDPRHRLQGKLNIAWDAGATCKNWEKFLGQIFESDTDRQEKISFLQEWFGYCLVPDTSQHKFLWLIGSGGNGKSVLLDILSELVGRENISNAQIQRLEKDSVRAELEGKLLNVSAEMTSEATIEGSYLKQIVAGDSIHAERKFQPSFNFRPYARIVGSTNDLPKLLDLSDGFARRAVILAFNRQFKEHEQDKGLTKCLIVELPGILAWAVQGLQRLKERGAFQIPQSSQEAVTAYRKESDPIGLFCQEYIRADDSMKMVTTDIYEVYRPWAAANGYASMSSATLGRGLKRLGFKQGKSGNKYWKVQVLLPFAETSRFAMPAGEVPEYQI